MEAVEDEKVKKAIKGFDKHLKYYWKSSLLNDRYACNFITDPEGPCMNAMIRVLLDAFDETFKHNVIALEDNWVSKEFMSASFDARYIYDSQSNTN